MILDLKNSSVAKANNYLFICFSAEELGLIGSKSFLDAKLFNEQNINYMINLDMVGRLDEKTKQLAVGGVGTASVFNTLTKEITAGELTIMTSESGMGPSDHASFYLKNIPVLFLFTGTHYDYHKPSDDAYKLNYTGMFNIKEYIEELIVKLDSQGKLTFIKTKEEENASAKRKFNVTMGVVPSYMYDGVGLKIDGVTEEKPAAKAGVHAGDILVKMATLEITDMMAYMNALSKFNKGDQIVIEVIRNGQKIPLNLTF